MLPETRLELLPGFFRIVHGAENLIDNIGRLQAHGELATRARVVRTRIEWRKRRHQRSRGKPEAALAVRTARGHVPDQLRRRARGVPVDAILACDHHIALECSRTH
jgi:hypothetical protein